MAPTPVLAAVWCCSVGATWTLELHELDRDTVLGTTVKWISSGIPVTQPAPDALASELLAEQGLRLFRDSSVSLGNGSRYHIGYVCVDDEAGLDPAVLAALAQVLGRSGGGGPGQERAGGTVSAVKESLTVTALPFWEEGVLVLRLVGEIDLATVGRLRDHLQRHVPGDYGVVVLDCTEVSFLGACGLGLLAKVADQARAEGSALRLVAQSRIILRALKVTGMDKLIPTTATVAEVVEQYSRCIPQQKSRYLADQYGT